MNEICTLPHWEIWLAWGISHLAFFFWERWLGRTKKLPAASTLDLIQNAASKIAPGTIKPAPDTRDCTGENDG